MKGGRPIERVFHLWYGHDKADTLLKPHVPISRIIRENSTTPRICVAHDLDECLTGLSLPGVYRTAILEQIREGKEEPEPVILPFVIRTYLIPDDFPGFVPNEELWEEVPDGKYSGECWITQRLLPARTTKLWLRNAAIHYEMVEIAGERIVYPMVFGSLWSATETPIAPKLNRTLADFTVRQINYELKKKGNQYVH